jgi:hypothetical protein
LAGAFPSSTPSLTDLRCSGSEAGLTSVEQLAQTIESRAPEVFVLFDPVRDFTQRPWVQVIKTLASDTSLSYEPDAAEDLELLRDRRLRQIESRSQFRCRRLATPKKRKKRAPYRTGNGGEDVRPRLKSVHAGNI